MSRHVKVTTTPERIVASCTFPGCGLAALTTNQGLGRARIAAFKSRHQHTEGESA